jgi:hypothetical protein
MQVTSGPWKFAELGIFTTTLIVQRPQTSALYVVSSCSPRPAKESNIVPNLSVVRVYSADTEQSHQNNMVDTTASVVLSTLATTAAKLSSASALFYQDMS